jgi:aldose sugar dehydrogenase
MQFKTFLGFCATICMSVAITQPALSQNSVGREASALYTQNCAACHGRALNGGMAPSMLDDQWRFGSEDSDLVRSIAKGHPPQGMPGFEKSLSAEEIRALVVYIREQRAQSQRKLEVGQALPGKPLEVNGHRFVMETVATNIKTPWAVEFLPDGRMLVTELRGRLLIVDNKVNTVTAVKGIPKVRAADQGGLLDVALHPEFERNGWIYLSFSDPGQRGASMTRIVRGRLRNNVLVEQADIYRAPAQLYRRTGYHFGNRITFDKDNFIYFGIGDRGFPEDAQSLKRPNGKIHRLHADGRIPDDNPFLKTPGALASIWTLGNRNPQGLTLDKDSGILWEVEHGPRGGDELNFIQRGLNYGWPVITYGMNYDGTAITSLTAREGLEQPIRQWTPSLGIAAIQVYRGEAFPRWRGQLLISSLASEELRLLSINELKVNTEHVLFQGYGRVRDVTIATE